MVILYIYNKNLIPVLSHILFSLPFIIYLVCIIPKIDHFTFKQEITTLNNYILENHLNTVEIIQEIRLYCQKKENNVEKIFKQYIISIVSFWVTTILSYFISNLFDLKFDSIYNAIFITIHILIPVITIFITIYTIIIAESFSIRDYYTYKRLDTLLTELIIKKYQEKQ